MSDIGPRVAFVTCRALPAGSDDDRLAATACERRGLRVESVPWEVRGDPWGGFDAIVVRSAWTYHRMPDRFDGWLDRVARARGRVFNAVDAMRRNARKSYLLALARAGVPVIPTLWAASAADLEPTAIEAALGTLDLVAKPAVGASAEGVFRARADRPEDRERIAAALASGPQLLQRYVPEIAARGEWSLIHLGDSFSHAVLKSPGPGDFRVQEALGGSIRAAEPPAAILDLARAALAAEGAAPLYARIDAVETAAGPLLVELELVEPSLFFAHAPGAAERFADALTAAMEAP